MSTVVETTKLSTTFSGPTTVPKSNQMIDVADQTLNLTSVKIHQILKKMEEDMNLQGRVNIANITKSLQEIEDIAAEFAFALGAKTSFSKFGDVEVGVRVPSSRLVPCFNSLLHRDCLIDLSRVAIPDMHFQNGQLGNNSNAVIVATQFKLPEAVLDALEPKNINGITEGFQNHKFLDHRTSQLSASVYDTRTRKKIQANLTFLVKTTGNVPRHKVGDGQIAKAKYSCEYFDTTKQEFSTKGCYLVKSDSEDVTCFCNHTTIFAVLLSVTTFQIPQAVTVISYITEALSVISLVFTLVVLVQVRKQLRSERTVVQINLTTALLLLHTFNLIHDLAYLHSASCLVLVVILHYFLLSTGAWMFLEAFGLAMMTSQKALYFDSVSRRKLFIFRLVVGWVIPFVIVLVTLATGLSTGNYVKKINSQIPGLSRNLYDRCWLTSEGWVLVGSTIIPLAVVYVVNLLVAVKVLLFIYGKSKETLKFMPTVGRVSPSSGTKHTKVDTTHIKAAMKGFLLLFPVFGLPWILSFLTGINSYEGSVAFMYLNVLFNGLQGVFLMLVYCVLGGDVRKAWMRKIKCILRTEISSSTETSGTHTGQTTLPRS